MEENNDAYIYIVINNINPVDFQSMIIKYKSWDKFIEDIQNIDFCENINGTMNGLLHPRNAIATIDFKDDFHAKYHFESPLLKNQYSTAYVIKVDDMDCMLEQKV